MNKTIYIIDIRKKQKNSFFLNDMLEKNADIVSLTPYSCYLLDGVKRKYLTYHDLITIKKFREEVFNEYSKIENIFDIYPQFGFLFRDIAFIKNYEVYLSILFIFIKEKKEAGYKVVYISDTKYEKDIDSFSVTSNDTSGLYYCSLIDDFIVLNKKDDVFYRYMKFMKNIMSIKYLSEPFTKIWNKIKYKQKLNYDNKYFKIFWGGQATLAITKHIDEKKYINFMEDMQKVVEELKFNSLLYPIYKNILNSFKEEVYLSKSLSKVENLPFSYLSSSQQYIKNLLYYKNNIPRVMWQHGSYLHEHIFLKYNEVMVADINLVCNGYTKKLFFKYKEQGVYNVGAISLNQPIKEKNKKYDFVYIINNMHYSWTGTYIDSYSASYSMDGYNLYKRHKDIIELFGISFSNKRICIKMQPGITSNLLYVPLLELAKSYSNVTIHFFIPLKQLISQSKYIISDYFSSEFINRELHYKRDIILFKGAPTPLPEETLEDMKKMFILVDTIDDLKDKIENIEKITQNRKRYDDIIEYYSSKKCDTKKVVTQILEKELK